MKRFVLAVLVIASCASCKSQDYEAFYDQYSRSIVKIECIDPQTKQWRHIGSGFVLDAYNIVTAAHVVDWGPEPRHFRFFIEGKKFGIKKLWTSPSLENDVAIIGLNMKTDTPGLKLADKDARIGTETFTMGYPLWMDKLFTRGYVNQQIEELPITEGNYTRFYYNLTGFSNAIFPGDSGGPVLLKNGKVAGIVFGHYIDAWGNPLGEYGFFTPTSQIKESLAFYRRR